MCVLWIVKVQAPLNDRRGKVSPGEVHSRQDNQPPEPPTVKGAGKEAIDTRQIMQCCQIAESTAIFREYGSTENLLAVNMKCHGFT